MNNVAAQSAFHLEFMDETRSGLTQHLSAKKHSVFLPFSPQALKTPDFISQRCCPSGGLFTFVNNPG